jgi:hypothetical protein
MNDARAHAVQRIRHAATDFKFDFSRQASHAALFREHLRRMAVWADKLGCSSLSPFFDVAALLFPNRFATDVEPELIPLLNHFSSAFRASLVAAVRFAEIADAAEVRAWALLDPYEPLIRLLERGGNVITEHGMIYIGTVGFPRKQSPPKATDHPLMLDDATLDALDADRSPRNYHPLL